MRYKRIFAIFILTIFFLSACSGKDGNAKVVLTAGFGKDEIFRIENMICTKQELMVYLTNMQNQYEEIFGPEIWQTDLDGVMLEQNVKDTALSRIAQIKSMNLLAANYEVTLDEEEEALASQVAQTYYASLSEAEKNEMGVTAQTIETLYKEYAIADKIYQYIIKDINPEISDDEARTITVQNILIKTYALDGTGKKIEYSERNKAQAYELAKEVLKKAEDGEDFEKLVDEYSEGDQSIFSFGKGEMEPAFETAVFNLGTDEISDIVETSFGYHIIKCINTFNREETDNNKVKIVNQRREEVFGQEYDNFVNSLTKTLNDDLWDSVTFIREREVTTSNFFDLYDEGFKLTMNW